MTEIVDAHHRIWRQADVAGLSGPMQPRSFKNEAASVQWTAGEHGWPHRILAYSDFSVDDVHPQLDRLARSLLVRGVRMQLHWHKNPSCRFAGSAELCADPVIRRNNAHLADYDWSFDLQVFAPQMADAAALARACLKITSIRAGVEQLAACPNVVSKLSGLGTVPSSQRSGAPERCAEPDRCDFGRRALPRRLELQNREVADQLPQPVRGRSRRGRTARRAQCSL